MKSRIGLIRPFGIATALLLVVSGWVTVAAQTNEDSRTSAGAQADKGANFFRQSPLAPAEALAMIELEPNNFARILAHEPQVIDPVEVVFDDAGRMWVVQMLDYPFCVVDQPRGRISVLTDGDGNGSFEQSHIFADHLDMPTGMALWKNGAVVTVAGKLIYLTDSDGDLRADDTQVWLEGFAQENEQLRANHPRLGPDGWWYIACGLRGGKVQLGSDLRGDSPAEPLEIGSRDVRFHLATKRIELVTGPAQFGLTFDSVGHRLFCSNRNPATQVVFEQADLTGNPLAGLLPSIVDVVPAGEQSKVYPLVDAWVTSHLHTGQFTAACGVFAQSLSDSQTDIFTCEPTGSLVHRQRSKRSGGRLISASHSDGPKVDSDQTDAHITAGDPAAEREWLASRDPWFRPVNMNFAPDGGLVVVDMHRAVIEHPAWVPEELRQRPDERWGDQAGRIYWIGSGDQSDPSWSELRSAPLGSRPNSALVTLLASDNPWLRQTAERLLIERQASESLEALWSIVNDLQQSDATRISALRLCMLLPNEASQSIWSDTLWELIERELANRPQSDLAVFALRSLRQADLPSQSALDLLLRLALNASDSGVRFEAWLSLAGRHEDIAWRATPEAATAVARRWIEDGDSYMLMAAASGLRAQPNLMLHSLLVELASAPTLDAQAQVQIAQTADSLMSASLRQSLDVSELSAQIQKLIINDAELPLTAGQNAARLAALHCLQPLVRNHQSKQPIQQQLWSRLIEMTEDTAAPMNQRTAAAGLLAYSPAEATSQHLQDLVLKQSEPELTIPLLQAWCAVGGPAPNQFLLERLPSAAPRLQRTILSLIAASPQRLALLAERLDAGHITPGQLGASELGKLVDSASGDTQRQLQKHLASILNSDRALVVERYKDCIGLQANANRGIELFRKHCASCHRVGEIGVDVGPNISDSRTKLPLELLTAILDPNRAIDNNYFRFIVLTEEDRVIEGIIAEETAEALVIRGQDDRRELIRREDIATIKATGVSLMPEGLEAQLDLQAMADLIAFIKGWRYMDGAVPVQP